MQFEAAISVFFLLFLYGTMMVITFDDDQEEFLEYFEQLLLTSVFYVFTYYVIRIGVHFFSFSKNLNSNRPAHARNKTKQKTNFRRRE